MNISPAEFDSRAYRRARIAQTQPRFAWENADLNALEAWQSEFREEFARVLGDLSAWEIPDLAPQVLGRDESENYRRETIAFSTRPGLKAVGHLLIPNDLKQPRGAILCLPGHGRGIDGNIGLRLDGTRRDADESDATDAYALDFPLQCVARGYVTFVLELIGFGYRRDEIARQSSPNTSSCTRDSMAALMLGETMAGWRVWDAMRALDYLQSRKDIVDGARLATMGISGGGLVSLFCAALDTRVQACVVSGYFNTFAGSVLNVDHCVDNFVPGLLNVCEMPDLAALVAPRALFCESGTHDTIFPVETTREAIEKTQKIYATMNVATQFDSEIFDGGHQFHGTAAFNWLQQKMPPRA